MPNYDHGKYLRSALESLVSQSISATEILIIDDGSTDNSRQIIEEYAARYGNIHPVYHEHNLGSNATVDELIHMAACDCLFAMGADDMVLPGFFEKSLALLVEFPKAAFCSSLCRTIGKHGEDLHVSPRGIVRASSGYISPAEAQERLICHSPWFCGNSTIYQRDRLLAAGGFRRELGPYCDGFIKDVLAMRHGVCFVPEILTCWRDTGDNFSVVYYSVPENFEKMTETSLELMRMDYADVYTPRHRKLFKIRSDFILKVYLNEQRRAQCESRLLHLQLSLSNAFYILMRRLAYLIFTPPLSWWRTIHYFWLSYWIYLQKGIGR